MNMLIIFLLRPRTKLSSNTTTNKINPLRHLPPCILTTSINISSPPILQLLRINIILLHGKTPKTINKKPTVKYIPTTPTTPKGETKCHK
jgi:hypothetical protein